MSEQPFVHLHCHSHFSLLDGASRIDELVAQAKQHGMNALALTDHGNLYGALEFYRKARAAEINPILGYEAYIAPLKRSDRDGGMKDSNYHLTLLAQNRTGFKNLIKLASKAYLEGFYFKPRIDKEILAAHSEGIICLSGCVSSELNRMLLRGGGTDKDLDAVREVAKWFHDVFDDRYYIEIQNNGLEIQQLAMQGALGIAHDLGLPVVATSDAHYVNREDAEAQDILLCINTGKFRTDTKRMKMEGDEFFLRAPSDMYRWFAGHEEAVARSQQIADSVDIDLELGKRYFPVYKLPEGKQAGDYLRELCLAGLKDRYADNPQRIDESGELRASVLERLDRELGVIEKLGFPNYFLIVWDFVVYARQQNIPATARGSGVGALVCYALYLSHVCPLEYDLLFERFLDESRLEAPDIDIDFCKDRRGDVMQFVKDKYGSENVAQIGTFGTLAARAAIRDVGRAMSLPVFRVDKIVAMVPDKLGIKLREAIKKSDELRAAYESDGEVRELLDLAMRIEGLARNVGTHAAAVVIGDQPLTEYVPLQRVTGKEDVITQWSMNDVEAAGLLKMDFLGLRNLTILSKAVELIEQTTGRKVDPLKFPLDDQPTYDLLCRGETKGVFQLESGGIRDLLQKMKPDSFRDIIATNALYRPGPLEGGMVDDYVSIKHGRKQAVYPHPVMEEVLAETYGVMVYQEQVMRILNRLGNIDLSSAYKCIKAISKKKLETIAAFREQFLASAADKGMTAKQAAELWEMIEKFAGYGFNKSHSTAYALIAYQTAYLKAHYPLEFMAALLTGDIPNRNFKSKDALVEHIEDCRRMNIKVMPPDVNASDVDFAVTDGKIHFALSAIKGCGGGAAEAIVATRKAHGPFADLFNFCERVDSRACNRAAIETLIKAGAFDALGGNRAQLTAVIDKAMQAGAALLKDRRSGQANLFDEISPEEAPCPVSANLPDIPDWDERDKLSQEKEVLGYYLSSHPLAEYEAKLKTYCTHVTTDLADAKTRSEVMMGGMLSALKFSHTKNPRPGSTATKYVMFDLEDIAGVVRCILWPEQFEQYGELVEPEAILVVRGKVDRRPGSDGTNIVVDELISLDDLDSRYTTGVRIRYDEKQHGEQGLVKLREILRAYPGDKQLELVLDLADGRRVWMPVEQMRIELNPEMRERVDQLLGPGNQKLITNSARRRQPVAAANGNGRRG